MLVHFIGGPAHGRTQSDVNPQSIYRMAEAKQPIAFCAVGEEEGLPPLGECPFTEHEYRVTKHTRRYCIAEWQPRPVKVRVAVEFNGLEFWDREVHDKMMRLVHEHEKTGTLALTLDRHHYGTGALTLEWSVEVEGPADGAAVAEATETVQHRLDVALGEGNYVRQVSAQVNAD
jgi:hypothetical protein